MLPCKMSKNYISSKDSTEEIVALSNDSNDSCASYNLANRCLFKFNIKNKGIDDYKTLLIKSADAGNPIAQFDLALKYYHGYKQKNEVFFEKNASEAFENFKKSSVHHPPSLYYLGLCHLKGYGTARDEKMAVQLLTDYVKKCLIYCPDKKQTINACIKIALIKYKNNENDYGNYMCELCFLLDSYVGINSLYIACIKQYKNNYGNKIIAKKIYDCINHNKNDSDVDTFNTFESQLVGLNTVSSTKKVDTDNSFKIVEKKKSNVIKFDKTKHAPKINPSVIAYNNKKASYIDAVKKTTLLEELLDSDSDSDTESKDNISTLQTNDTKKGPIPISDSDSDL
jgi:hypothetical protein